MKIDINNLPSSAEQLQKIIFLQQQEIADYKDRYVRLLEKIKLERTRVFSPSSEKNILQSDLFDEAGVELPEEAKEQLVNEVEVKFYTRKKHPVRRPLPDYLSREVVMHDIPEADKICSCGEQLVRIGEDISEQLKYIPAQISVIQHVRPKYACKPCQENVKIAAMPVLLLPKSIATPELVAHVIISKYCDHLPLYRQEAIWQRMEVDMPRSSLCGWVLKTAELCEPLIKLLQKNIITYDYAQVDETSVQVLNEVGRDNRTKSYMWVYRGGGEQPSVVYEYQETRGGYHAQQFLTGFKGYLQSDAFSGYNWAHDTKDIVSIGCHAHARRPFAELAKTNKSSGLSHDALKFYRKLYTIEKDARDRNLSSEDRYQLRQDKSVPILDGLKKWLDHHLPKTSEQGAIGKAIRYCLSHWVELNNFLKNGCIEIDNNLIENAIRPFAIGRKNWLFSGSPSGAKAGAVFFSLIETCKANNVEPYRYLCAMLNCIRECATEEDYRNLLPQFIQF
ncbi:MAG: IS66 family transposase [Gammaproteobacteria bacterium]